METTLQRPATSGRIISLDLGAARRRPRLLLAGIAVLLVLAVVATFVLVRARAGAVAYTTVPITTGSLAQTVTASGTVNAQNTVSVGTQVSGTISEVDVDFNTKVKKDEVLARLDPTTLQAQLASAQASLAQSEAQAAASGATAAGGSSSVAQAQAQSAAAFATAKAAQDTIAADNDAVASAQTNVTKAQSALTLAQTTVTRDRTLLAQGYVAQNQVDTDTANVVADQSALDAAKAAVAQSQAQVAAAQGQAISSQAAAQAQQAGTGVSGATAEEETAAHQAQVAAIGIQQAAVAQAEKAVSNAVITSPVDGTVVARDVSVGETVASSLQTPTLFSIAQDLSKMEVDLAVGESDIGRVGNGDPVAFSVLAYPNRVFHGTIAQVRKAPVTTNNVVTYTTVVDVNNSDGALLPGMTANATIQVAHVDNATIVPLAALSFRPSSGAFTHRRSGAGATAKTPAAAKPQSASPWGGSSAATGAVTPGGRGLIFVLRAAKLTAVPVTVGLVTDTAASVTPLRGTLSASDAAITAQTGGSSAHGSASRSGAANPLGGGQSAGRGMGGLR